MERRTDGQTDGWMRWDGMGIEGRLVVSSRPVYMKDEFLSCCASALSEEKNRIGEDSPKTRLFHYVVVPEKKDEVENKWPERSVGRSLLR